MAGFTGGCLCGEIRYEVTGEPVRTQICHCNDCRKVTGSSFATNVFVNSDDLKITTGSPRQFRHIAASGNERVKEFCEICGSQLFSWGPGRPEIKGIKVGSIDGDVSFVKPWAHVWVSRALPITRLDDKLPKFEENVQ